MKIILNFLPLKTGGGVQVALDFLRQAELYGKDHQWFIVARENSPFSSFKNTNNIQLIHLVPDNILSRLAFEYFGCKTIIKKYKPDLTYTQFGPHWPGSNVVNVAGCAYSNLFYPEINFWEALPLYKRILKKVIDRQRLNRILGADHRVFETEDLQQRAIKQYALSPNKTHFVKAAASSLVSMGQADKETAKRCSKIPKGYRVGLLSGYHPNKNIELLVKTASKLKKQGKEDIVFVLTLPDSDAGAKNIMDLANELGVSQQIFNLGPIPQSACIEFYRSIDVAVLPSKLESFSNMIAESWATETPLLISDLSWARSLCLDGAIYFDYCSAAFLARQILRLRGDKEFNQKTVENGSKALLTYPTSKERFLQYLSIIEEAHV